MNLDFITKKEKEDLIKEIRDGIKVKDGVSPSKSEIVQEVLNKLHGTNTNLGDIQGVGFLVDRLRAGGFRGGGDTVVAGDNITITQNGLGQKVIASTGGISNITGLIEAGDNITLDGTGTSLDPYVINSSGGGTPGGSNNQFQYNNAGTFGGTPYLTLDGTDILVGGNMAFTDGEPQIYFYDTYPTTLFWSMFPDTNTMVLVKGDDNQALRLNFNSITTTRTQTFPDKNGTFAMTSDIVAQTPWLSDIDADGYDLNNLDNITLIGSEFNGSRIGTIDQDLTNNEGISLNIYTGAGNGVGAGGTLNIFSGNGGDNNAQGGTISISAGNGTGTAQGGDVNIIGGYDEDLNGYGGELILPGTTPSGRPADTILYGAYAVDGDGGNLSLLAGTAGTSGAGGNILIEATEGVDDNNGGQIEILAGDGSDTGFGGNITIQSGIALGDSDGGNLNLYSGDSDGGDGGTIDIRAGDGGITGGYVQINAGSASDTDGVGGIIEINGGIGNGAGDGGEVNITGGIGGSSGNGSDINIYGGSPGSSGLESGSVVISAGTIPDGNADGGYVQLEGGDITGSGNGTPGDIRLSPGYNPNTLVKGKIRLQNRAINFDAILDPTSINTSDKTFTFPNQSGTLALVSSSLTNTRVPFSNASGVLVDDSDFTFVTDTLTVTKIAATTFTGNITLSTKDIVTDTTTGTKIATGATQKLGFWNATPVVQSTGWTMSNVTTDKTLDANSTTLDEVADVLGTLIDQLKTYGILGA